VLIAEGYFVKKHNYIRGVEQLEPVFPQTLGLQCDIIFVCLLCTYLLTASFCFEWLLYFSQITCICVIFDHTLATLSSYKAYLIFCIDDCSDISVQKCNNKNLAIADRSRISCAHDMSRASLVTP